MFTVTTTTEKKEKPKPFICAICDKKIINEHSHDAWPIINGRCCAYCNADVVILARIQRFRGQR